MRNLLLSALILASAFQTAVGQIVEGRWTYIVENGGATITASTATGAVTIPSELGGYAVKRVGNDTALFDTALFGDSNTSVTSVVIPNSVTSIGYSAFYGCTGLNSLTIPNSVTSIGDYAFAGCSGLTSLTIPSSVTIIGDGVFSDCTGLITMSIPSSVTSIGDSAFAGCSGLTSLTIPNGVVSILAYTFANCTSLTSLTIPNSVTSIGMEAFIGCTSLTSISLSPGLATDLKYLGVNGQVASDAIVQSIANALANNDAFVTAVANKILAKNGNYGLSVKSELETLATKTELTSSLAQSRTDGINSVLSNPNLWTLYTTSQIQNMAVGDLVLTKNVGGTFTLNYDIEQSTDLQTWTTYQALSLPLTGLPTDKAFVRIKPKQ